MENVSSEKYLTDVKSHLECNMSEEDKKKFYYFTYSNNQIEEHIDYFKKCKDNCLSAYKALLFFHDYLNKDYII